LLIAILLTRGFIPLLTFVNESRERRQRRSDRLEPEYRLKGENCTPAFERLQFLPFCSCQKVGKKGTLHRNSQDFEKKLEKN